MRTRPGSERSGARSQVRASTRFSGLLLWPAVLPRQPTLFDRGDPDFDRGLLATHRVQLDDDAWVDLAPGWVTGHERLFDELASVMRWRNERRHMYERVVDVPRLLASVPEDGPGHPLLEDMRAALSERYRERFEFVTLALYRDGSDSVAWHGDYVAREMPGHSLVATVSLGEPRRFLLRPALGGRARPFSLGAGDLIVMGGACQRTWRHSIPKVTAAGPRIAIMFRPRWFERARY